MKELELMLRMMALLEQCIDELDSRTRAHLGYEVTCLRQDIAEALESAKNDELI